MHTHLKIAFKWAVHFSTSCFNIGTKLFQAAINTITLQASLLLNASTPVQYDTPHF